MIICTASINSICKICLHHEGCCIDVDETSRAKEHYCELYILNYTTSAVGILGQHNFINMLSTLKGMGLRAGLYRVIWF